MNTWLLQKFENFRGKTPMGRSEGCILANIHTILKRNT